MRLHSFCLASILCAAPLALASCATAQSAHQNASHHGHTRHDEPRPYDRTADAQRDVRQAFERAQANGKAVMLVMGANWCHDSRALAKNFQTPRLKGMIDALYERVYIDVGDVQFGPRDRNIDIAQRYGIKEIVGTPTVLIITPQGKVLNQDTAPTWRNAASRSLDETYVYFSAYADISAMERQ